MTDTKLPSPGQLGHQLGYRWARYHQDAAKVSTQLIDDPEAWNAFQRGFHKGLDTAWKRREQDQEPSQVRDQDSGRER